MAKTYMITGATGYQGGSLVRVLLSQGHKIHALVRNPASDKGRALESAGVVLFEGGFDDLDVVKKALKGVDGAFLNPFPTPADPDLQVRQATGIIEAVADEGCHLVVSTAFLTQKTSIWEGNGPQDFLYLYYNKKFAIEKAVRSANLKTYTILRPSYLMHNYLIPFSNFHYPELPKFGLMRHMYNPGRKFAHLDSSDIGRLAAVALQDPVKFDKYEVDLGVQNLDADDAALALNKVGRRNDVHTERLVIKDFDTKTKTGLTWHYFANTQDVTLTNTKDVEEKFGLKLTTFEEYLEREKVLLEKSLPLPN